MSARVFGVFFGFFQFLLIFTLGAKQNHILLEYVPVK